MRIAVLKRGCALLFVLALGACGPRTTVVLVPDDDGHVGQVSVSTARDSRVLASEAEYVEVTKGISKPRRMSAETIDREFGQALAAVPARPQSTQLFFRSESAEPEPASLKLVPEIVAIVRAREIVRVTVIGHTDAAGDVAYNNRLSMARAESVKKYLLRAGIDPEIIRTMGFGPDDPLVPVKPGGHEPRNRRVEVFVR